MHNIRPAVIEDIDRVAANIRPEHEREAILAGLTGADALRFSFKYAASCYAFCVGGQAIFIAGAMEPDALDDSALCWMAGTPEMDNHAFPLLNASRYILGKLHDDSRAHRLENHVPADYRKAIKFAHWLGCRQGATSVRGGVEHVHIYHDQEKSQ